MMWNYDSNGWGWAGWCLMILTMAVLVAGIVWGVVVASRGTGSTEPSPKAEDLLAQRLARGEISEDDFKRQRDLITQHR